MPQTVRAPIRRVPLPGSHVTDLVLIFDDCDCDEADRYVQHVNSSWRPETDSNFGAVFPIWDLLFGTFRPEPRDGHQTMELGLAEIRGPEAQRLLPLLLSPLRRSL